MVRAFVLLGPGFSVHAHNYARRFVEAVAQKEVRVAITAGSIASAPVSLVVPFVVLQWLEPSSDVDATATDKGWMLRPSESAGDAGKRVVYELEAAASEGRFLVWIADSF
jgi:hypothetical protein